MNVISAATIKRFAALHTDAAGELLRWNKAASRSVWRELSEVKAFLNHAEYMRGSWKKWAR
ncbi:MAG: hypothetical protein Q8N47_02770 [Bryobacterales bacterium]|nr:hypothetical protein [Bryobacterales bacterium]